MLSLLIVVVVVCCRGCRCRWLSWMTMSNETFTLMQLCFMLGLGPITVCKNLCSWSTDSYNLPTDSYNLRSSNSTVSSFYMSMPNSCFKMFHKILNRLCNINTTCNTSVPNINTSPSQSTKSTTYATILLPPVLLPPVLLPRGRQNSYSYYNPPPMDGM